MPPGEGRRTPRANWLELTNTRMNANIGAVTLHGSVIIRRLVLGERADVSVAKSL